MSTAGGCTTRWRWAKAPVTPGDGRQGPRPRSRSPRIGTGSTPPIRFTMCRMPSTSGSPGPGAARTPMVGGSSGVRPLASIRIPMTSGQVRPGRWPTVRSCPRMETTLPSSWPSAMGSKATPRTNSRSRMSPWLPTPFSGLRVSRREVKALPSSTPGRSRTPRRSPLPSRVPRTTTGSRTTTKARRSPGSRTPSATATGLEPATRVSSTSQYLSRPAPSMPLLSP